MDTRNFDAHNDPWKGVRDVDVHEARDQRAAEARRITHDHLAVPAGQALLRLPEFASIHAPALSQETPLKRDREALRRRQKRSLFGKQA